MVEYPDSIVPNPRSFISGNLRLKLFQLKPYMCYGHTTTSFENSILLIGGFGRSKDGSDSRIKQLKCFSPEIDDFTTLKSEFSLELMHQTAHAINETITLCIGGRKSPRQVNSDLIIIKRSPNEHEVNVTETKIKLHEELLQRWRHAGDKIILKGE